MLKMNPLLMMDGYKTDHRRQYLEGTEVALQFTKTTWGICSFTISALRSRPMEGY
jgi:hypothetical protein